MDIFTIRIFDISTNNLISIIRFVEICIELGMIDIIEQIHRYQETDMIFHLFHFMISNNIRS